MFNRYREHGLPLIPVEPGDKRPLAQLTGWQQFCERLPFEDECDAWERLDTGRYGMPLGPAGGVMAIDIDSDDARVMEAVPPSPVRKRGKKGETRFFRYSPDVPSGKVAMIIDILCVGRHTVMPPTTHPDTGQPYVWLTPDTLPEFPVSELPAFTAEDLERLRNALEGPTDELVKGAAIDLRGPFIGDGSPTHPWPHGSHDRLKYICNGLIARGASPDEAVRELVRYDEENHRPVGYFFCRGMASDQKSDNPHVNAFLFYSSNYRTHVSREVRQGKAPAVPLLSGGEILQVDLSTVPEPFKPMEWPEPKGLLAEIRQLIDDSSYRHQPAISLGGAIAIGSVVLANRAKLMGNWPNLYVLNVAPTGAGKSFPYSVASQVLTPENGLDLIGCGGYRSSSAMIKDLMGRRERLDLVDECSSLFRSIRDGNVFQADMLDILNALWAGSSGMYVGPESVGRERVSVWHPCVSALFSTTPAALTASMSRDFLTHGLIPRCLVFHDADYGQIKYPSILREQTMDIAQKLLKLRGQLGKGPAGRPVNLVNPRPDPVEIAATTEALVRLNAYRTECNDRMPSAEEVERHFLTRAAQQATKLSLLHGALRCLVVDIEDVEWAIATLEACSVNSASLIHPLAAENLQESNVLRVAEIIRRLGSISHSRLIGKTRFLRTNERNEILSSLETEGRIAMSLSTTKSRVWTFVK